MIWKPFAAFTGDGTPPNMEEIRTVNYIDISQLEGANPDVRAFAVANAICQGIAIKAGDDFRFSIQEKELEFDSPDDLQARVNEARFVSGKIWISMRVTREDIQKARWMLGVDPRFSHVPGNLSMFIVKNPG